MWLTLPSITKTFVRRVGADTDCKFSAIVVVAIVNPLFAPLARPSLVAVAAFGLISVLPNGETLASVETRECSTGIVTTLAFLT